MDVLNTYGGGIDIASAIFAILLGILALLFFVLAIAIREGALVILALLCASFALVNAASIAGPVRHEVTLRPGYVIDATKYEVVEQRGEIYVIEERGGAE